MEKLTELQWAKKGYVLNADATGEEGWNNAFYRYRVIRYPQSEVHENQAAAKAIISAKNQVYRKAARARKGKRQRAAKYRDEMKTAWQWLQEGRVPNADATWEHGEDLNRRFGVCAYGSKYYYCHFDCTHLPSSKELEDAISAYKCKVNKSYY